MGHESTAVLQRYSKQTNQDTEFAHYQASPVDIVVYDIRGRVVATFADDLKQAGSHSYDWASPLLPSGVYLCQMRTNSFQKTIKMVLQN